MPDFLQAHAPEWLERFRRQGYRDVSPLAAGVEGAVYDLGDGTVAKVWGKRREAELALMQRFYADVASAGLPLATPEIHRIYQAGGKAVTIERKLPGQPLRPPVSGTQPLDPEAAGCFIDVLRALASVPCSASMRRLPVLNEDRSLWDGAETFPGALIGLLDRRVARFGEVIRGRLPDFDLRYERLREKLTGLRPVVCTVIHGDLVPGNILVDSRARPVAVLDFGFLTTAGDPAFDAATAAAIFDMYGPHARQITRALTAQLTDSLGYRADLLLTYQAAYAVATSNAFTPDGSDGHFDWCMTQLGRTDIAAALAQ